MRISQDEVTAMNYFKDFLKGALEGGPEGNHIKGVYGRVVSRLEYDARNGEDIAVAEGYSERYPDSCSFMREFNRRKFTPDMIKEVALNEFTRYIFYELKGGFPLKLTEILRKEVSNRARQISMKEDKKTADACWYSALDEIAERVCLHWGTPLEAIE